MTRGYLAAPARSGNDCLRRQGLATILWSRFSAGVTVFGIRYSMDRRVAECIARRGRMQSAAASDRNTRPCNRHHSCRRQNLPPPHAGQIAWMHLAIRLGLHCLALLHLAFCVVLHWRRRRGWRVVARLVLLVLTPRSLESCSWRWPHGYSATAGERPTPSGHADADKKRAEQNRTSGSGERLAIWGAFGLSGAGGIAIIVSG